MFASRGVWSGPWSWSGLRSGLQSGLWPVFQFQVPNSNFVHFPISTFQFRFPISNGQLQVPNSIFILKSSFHSPKPCPAVGGVPVFQHLPSSPRPSAEHPTTRLNQAAASEVASNVYIGQVTLDVNKYWEAKEALALSDKEQQIRYDRAMPDHLRDVKAAQDVFQSSELVVDNQSWLPSIAPAGKWLTAAAAAARAHTQCLMQMLGVEASDVATVNAISLNNVGPLKAQIMGRLQREIPHLGGATLIFHPAVPRQAFSRTVEGAPVSSQDLSADGDGDDLSDSQGEGLSADGDEMSDGREEAALGVMLEEDLPESVTMSSARLAARQNMASLNADRQANERALTADLGEGSAAGVPTRFANPLHFIHKQDGSGTRKVTEAVMILPTSEHPIGLEQSIALRHGAFVGVESPRSFVVATRKEAARARRAMAGGWPFDSKMASCKFNGSSAAQGQIGEDTVEAILKDLVKTCSKKAIVANNKTQNKSTR